MASSTSSAIEMMVEKLSSKAAMGTKVAVKELTHSGIVERYVTPLIQWSHFQYSASSARVRLALWGCIVALSLPFICTLASVVMMAIGIVIVTGAAYLVMISGCLLLVGFVIVPWIYVVGSTVVAGTLVLRTVKIVIWTSATLQMLIASGSLENNKT